MKVLELFDLTLALMNENKDNSAPYRPFTIGMVNNLLMDLFDTENAIRQEKNLPLLEEVPFVEDEESEVLYDKELCYNVLPWGLGRQYFLGDDEYSKATFWDSQYQAKKDRAGKASYEPILDHYGGMRWE